MDELKELLLNYNASRDSVDVESDIKNLFPKNDDESNDDELSDEESPSFPFLDSIKIEKENGHAVINMVVSMEDEESSNELFGIDLETFGLSFMDTKNLKGDSYPYNEHFTLSKVEGMNIVVEHTLTDDIASENEDGWHNKISFAYFNDADAVERYFLEKRESYIVNAMKEKLEEFLEFSDFVVNELNDHELIEFIDKTLLGSPNIIDSLKHVSSKRFEPLMVSEANVLENSPGMA